MANKISANRKPAGLQTISASERAHHDLQTRSPKLFLFIFLTFVALLILVLPGLAALEHANSSIPRTNSSLAPAYGVAFITSAEGQADEQQFANALATGAGWDRWPVYWFYIETSEGVFDWSRQDKAVQDDLAHGLQLNAILLGTPAFYTTSFLQQPAFPYRHEPRQGTLSLNAIEKATPQGLYEPVFLDGDTPGPDKVINPNNKWAVFVETAVNRYKPGGVLAQANNWPEGAGVTLWEMWNEPDLPLFWDASLADYARLLKVGYLAAKHAHADAQVMFAGLAMFSNPNYYDQVLDVYDSDSLAKSQSYYHDIAALHNYFDPKRTAFYTEIIGNAMANRDLNKSIWVNESGVAVWDDYPGPVWEPLSPLRASQQEQASFAIQSAFHGLAAGADALFHFQLYDGCGNQPQGTDFPPHNGELCDEDNKYNGLPCAGDANGLYRNPTDAACFTQHPQAETPRPVFSAYKVLTTYVHDVEPYWQKRAGTPIFSDTCPGSEGPQEWIALYQPMTNKRIVGMWARCERTETAVIEATAPDGKAQLVAADGSVQALTAVNGSYTITLPPATHRNPFPLQTINPTFPIGGRPYILIETDFRGDPPRPTATATNTPTPSTQPTATTSPTCKQVIINGGFEESDGWRIPNTPYPARYTTALAHSGSWSLQAGIVDDGDNVTSYSTARQTITIPHAPAEQMLHVQLYTVSEESTTLRLPAHPISLKKDNVAVESDRQMILLLDPKGRVVETLLMDRLNDESWQTYSFDLSDYEGESLELYFGVYNNGENGVTGMYVDDVKLGTCDGPPATATPSPTTLPFRSYAPVAIKGLP
jgi:hypothetical protein